MVNILMNGYLGRMGRVILELSKERDDLEVIAGVDYKAPENEVFSFSTYTDYSNIETKPDVIIDFSNPVALDGILSYALANEVPVVICTTGFSEEQLAKIDEASKSIPVFFSANMSIGVNLISELAKKAAEILYPGFNIEIVEAHHNQKLDAPSGTALLLAKRICEARGDMRFVLGRSGHAKREPDEIGIHALRYGSETGTHEIIISNGKETLTLKHEAENRALFAQGAMVAAKALVTMQPGLYDMRSIVE